MPDPVGQITLVLGTRPEIIKMSPVIRALTASDSSHQVIHTNQHYSQEMDAAFFRDLNLPPAAHNLGVGSSSHGAQTGLMLQRLEEILVAERPACVLVQGDTNSVLAGALAAAKLNIPVGHIEAGLRSYDRTMPEELNRVVADHLSTWFFAPTPGAVAILMGEGIAAERIVMTGNTVVDATLQNAAVAERCGIMTRLGLEPRTYVLLTLHRAENTDDRARLSALLAGLERIAHEHHAPLVFPMHPRTEKMLAQHGLRERLENVPGLVLLKPIGYLEFLALERNAAVVLTDSGGVQEEACVLLVPCVTVRENTERPETLAGGANVLCPAEPAAMAAAVTAAMGRDRNWPNPFGDGHAGERTVRFLRTQLAS